MKKHLLLTSLLAACVASTAFAASKLDPVVSVDLGPALLNFVGTCAKSKDAEAGDLVKNLRHVRVKVFEFSETPLEEIQAAIKGQGTVALDSNWSQIVSVNKPSEALVAIHVRMKDAEQVSGIVASIASHDQKGVLVEIDGDIRADQVEKIVARFTQDIPGLAPAGATKT